MNKQAYIVDVDGTLYSKRQMHINMMLELGRYYFFHPGKIKELFIIRQFRKMREDASYNLLTVKELCEALAENRKESADYIYDIIIKWMFTVPLDVISKCGRNELIGFLRKASDTGAAVYIYSDYPAEDKIRALGIDYEKEIFVADMPEIGGQKPNPKAMEYILSKIDVDKDKILYIGDRDDKDKASADIAGIEYCDVHFFQKNESFCG